MSRDVLHVVARSTPYDSPIAPLLARRGLSSLRLVGAALVATWAIVLPLGVWMAARDRAIDGRLLAAGATALVAVPDLLIAIAGLRDASASSALRHRQRHLFLPVLALTLIAAPALVRHARASMLDALGARYLLAAAARGVPYGRLLWRSALRAAANPFLSLFGLSFAALFNASMIVEVVMSWPGLGPLLPEAVRARDEQMILSGVMLSTVLLLVGNGGADILRHAVDLLLAR